MISHVPVFIFVTGRNAAAIICHRVCFRAKKGVSLFIVVVVTGDVYDVAERKLASGNDQL